MWTFLESHSVVQSTNESGITVKRIGVDFGALTRCQVCRLVTSVLYQHSIISTHKYHIDDVSHNLTVSTLEFCPKRQLSEKHKQIYWGLRQLIAFSPEKVPLTSNRILINQSSRWVASDPNVGVINSFIILFRCTMTLLKGIIDFHASPDSLPSATIYPSSKEFFIRCCHNVGTICPHL